MAHLRRYLTFTSLLLGALAFFVPPSAIAADPHAEPRTFRLLTFTEEPIYGLLYENNQTDTRVLAPAGELSDAYPLPDVKSLKLYRLVPPPPDAATSKLVKQLVAEIALESARPPLLVMLNTSAPGSLLPYQGRAVDFSFAGQPLNSIRFFNFHRTPIAVRFGIQDLQLAAGETRSLPYKATQRGEPIPFKVAALTNTGWEALIDSIQLMQMDVRMLAFATTHPVQGTPRFKFITDRTAPPKKPASD